MKRLPLVLAALAAAAATAVPSARRSACGGERPADGRHRQAHPVGHRLPARRDGAVHRAHPAGVGGQSGARRRADLPRERVATGGRGRAARHRRRPRLRQDPRFFIYYTSATDNRVAYVRRGSAARPVPIVTGIAKANIHNGGRLMVDRDGYLWIGTGDGGTTSRAQDTSSLNGKVLRVDTKGGAAPGNRFGRVFSYGHRNVQGLAQDRTGRVWESELGQNAQDEVNVLSVGRNYGWPLVEGKGNDSRYADPAWTWRPEDASPSGITIKGDSLYVAALRGQRVWRLRTSGATSPARPRCSPAPTGGCGPSRRTPRTARSG